MYAMSSCRFIIAVIVIQVACASCVHSYQQGSYFVFDIIKSTEATTTKGRLAIPAEALTQAKAKSTTTEEIKTSEFTIEIEETIQPKTSVDSAFELGPMTKIKPFTKTTRFGTETFDSESSKSVFGE